MTISTKLKADYQNDLISYDQLSNKAYKIAVYYEIGADQSLYEFDDGSKIILKHAG